MIVLLLAMTLADGLAAPKLPSIDDTALQKRLRSDEAFWYSDTNMPKVYQDWEGQFQGVFGVGNEPVGFNTATNGNREFPWAKPFGTDAADVTAIRFVLLPRKPDGTRWPVAIYRQPSNQSAFAWVYPAESVIGEILYLRSPSGFLKPFEVRTKTRKIDGWTAEAYRPFPTGTELYRTVAVKRPGWKRDKKTRAFMDSLMDGTSIIGPTRFADLEHPSRRSVDRSAHLERLAPLPNDLVDELLTMPFKRSAGYEWRDGDSPPHAPSTEAEYHIVPKNYTGGHVRVDSESCMDCHKATNKHVREYDATRNWHGRIRGSDGIFSLHPFDGKSLSPQNQPKLNAKLIESGVFAVYDPSMHLRSRYLKLNSID